MNDKFRFVIVSKDNDARLRQKDFVQVEKNIDNNVWIFNNTEKLTKVYNKQLEIARKEGNVDFLVFIHADVHFNVQNVVSNVLSCRDKYDIFGLCGCSKISVSNSPLNWFTGSKDFPNDRWGIVNHGEVSHKTFYNSNHQTVTDHDVACIDGLCIIFGPNALKSDIKFNEDLRFNCYDTQISFSAVIDKKLRLGVVIEPTLYHYSIGKSITTDDFLTDEEILRKQFNLDIPAGSKLEELIKNKKKS